MSELYHEIENSQAQISGLSPSDSPRIHATGAYPDHADRLISRGYAPMPIGGKAPAMVGPKWTLFDLTQSRKVEQHVAMFGHAPQVGDPTFEHIKRWDEATPDRYAVGTLFGGMHIIAKAHRENGLGVLLTERFRCFDVDSHDQRAIEIITTMAASKPGRVVSKIGSKGITVFFQILAEDLPAFTSARRIMLADNSGMIEILKAGQQTVIPPSWHYGIGKPYRWGDPDVTLFDHGPEELVAFSQDDIDQILALLDDVGLQPRLTGEGSRGGGGAGGGYERRLDNQFDSLDAYFLDHIDLWFEDLFAYLHKPQRRAGGRWVAVPNWRPSTTGRPLEVRKPSLEAMRGKIVDQGTSKLWRAVDFVAQVLGISKDDAWLWLSKRVDLVVWVPELPPCVHEKKASKWVGVVELPPVAEVGAGEVDGPKAGDYAPFEPPTVEEPEVSISTNVEDEPQATFPTKPVPLEKARNAMAHVFGEVLDGKLKEVVSWRRELDAMRDDIKRMEENFDNTAASLAAHYGKKIRNARNEYSAATAEVYEVYQDLLDDEPLINEQMAAIDAARRSEDLKAEDRADMNEVRKDLVSFIKSQPLKVEHFERIAAFKKPFRATRDSIIKAAESSLADATDRLSSHRERIISRMQARMSDLEGKKPYAGTIDTIKVGAGGGKTHAAIEWVAGLDMEYGVTFVVPTLAKGEEIHADLVEARKKRGLKSQNIVGDDFFVIHKGYTSEASVQPPPEDMPPYLEHAGKKYVRHPDGVAYVVDDKNQRVYQAVCKRPDHAEQIMKLGLTIASQCSECPFKDGCEKLKNSDDLGKAKVRITTHAALLSQQARGLGKSALLIVDEDIVLSAFNTRPLGDMVRFGYSVNNMTTLPAPVELADSDKELDAQQQAVAVEVWQILKDVFEDHATGYGITSDTKGDFPINLGAITNELGKYWKQRLTDAYNHHHKHQQRAARAALAEAGPKEAWKTDGDHWRTAGEHSSCKSFLKAVLKACEHGEAIADPISGWLTLARGDKSVVVCRGRMNNVKPAHFSRALTVFMSATMSSDEPIRQTFKLEPVRLATIDIEHADNTTLRMVHGDCFSTTSLGNDLKRGEEDKRDPREKAKHERNRKKLKRRFEVLNAGREGDIFVVRREGISSVFGEDPNHINFSRAVGMNSLENCSTGLIVGAPVVDATEIVLRYRNMTGKFKPLIDTKETKNTDNGVGFVNCKGYVQVKGKGLIEVEYMGFENKELQEIYHHQVVSHIEQAIGRLRLVRPRKDGKHRLVEYIGSYPLSLHVDDIQTFKEANFESILLAAVQDEGAIGSAKYMLETYADELFESVNQAEEWANWLGSCAPESGAYVSIYNLRTSGSVVHNWFEEFVVSEDGASYLLILDRETKSTSQLVKYLREHGSDSLKSSLKLLDLSDGLGDTSIVVRPLARPALIEFCDISRRKAEKLAKAGPPKGWGVVEVRLTGESITTKQSEKWIKFTVRPGNHPETAINELLLKKGCRVTHLRAVKEKEGKQ